MTVQIAPRPATGRRRLSRRNLVGAVLGLVVVVIASVLGYQFFNRVTIGAPVRAAVPASAPAYAWRDSECTSRLKASPETGGNDLPSVDKQPSAVTAVWLPGENQRPCAAQLTTDAGSAAALAADVDSSPKPPGEASCGSADGTEVQLYFTYPGRSSAERIDVELGGCQSVSAPGRGSRQASATLQTDLRPLAPPAWRARF